jgi:hypothetical protein
MKNTIIKASKVQNINPKEGVRSSIITPNPLKGSFAVTPNEKRLYV